MPLQFDQHEGVARKQRWRRGDLAAVNTPALAHPRQVGGEAAELEAMQRQPLAIRLELRAGRSYGLAARRNVDRRTP